MSGVAVAGIDGSVATETDGVDTARFNSRFHQFLANGLGAAFTERTIVFVRAALITMAFNFHGVGGI